MYTEAVVPALHATVWAVRDDKPELRDPVTVLPDGCIDILWYNDELYVVGPMTGPQPALPDPGDGTYDLRFDPGVAPAFLGIHAAELVDRRVPLADILTARDHRALTRRLRAGSPRSAVLARAVAGALGGRAGAGDVSEASLLTSVLAGRASIGAAATELHLSERQLHRRALALYGYGPKTLQRILRQQHGLTLLRAGTDIAEAAVRAGYADQAHFSRETRRLTGSSPAQLR